MKLPYWIVDAFAEGDFAGNPAGVCVVDRFPDDRLMLAVAHRNALSETAFVAREGEGWRIRWFTPTAEVGLCGHATVASAAVLFERVGLDADRLRFESRSGPLVVTRAGGDYVLDFPARPPVEADAATAAGVAAALGTTPESCWTAHDNLLAVLADEAAVRALAPDLDRVAALSEGKRAVGLIVTAPGQSADFASRYFAPAYGVPEDPATGSTHCTLVPYWARRMGRKEFVAHQVSARGGVFRCRDRGERVDIAGPARFWLEGRIEI